MRTPSPWITLAITALLVGCGSSADAPRSPEASEQCDAIFAADPCGNTHCQAVEP